MGAVAYEHAESEMGDFSDYELVHLVCEALKSARLGDTDEYHQIIGFLYQNVPLAPNEVAMLVTILTALTGAVSVIDDLHHRDLLCSICKMSLWNYVPNVMDALVKFVVALATWSGKYFDLGLDFIVSNFIPPQIFFEILKKPLGQAKKDQVLSRVHSALKGISDLVPLAPSRLEQIVRERVQQYVSSKEHNKIALYVENMLMLASGDLGELVGNSMIFELVNRLLELDLKIDLDDPSKGICDMDESQKLDALMDLTFNYLHSCFKNGRLVQVFEALLQSFQRTVLNADKPKFVQFVMFYACSLDPEDCGTQFVSRLVEIFENTFQPDLWRINAVAYLASYLSRAKFLSASYVTVVLESLVDWCYKYCQNKNGVQINPNNHRVFYAGCEAIMYVLCFRMRSILAFPILKSQLFNMPLERILKHAFNPLEVCSPSVVNEFLSQAKAAPLFYVSGALVVHGLGGYERLNLFFPFVSYLLKDSYRFIHPNFINDDDDEEFDMNSIKMSISPCNSFMFENKENPRMQMPSRIRPSTSPEYL